MDVEETLDEVAGWLRGARRIVALTGAGISTESGIPDFRGPNGLWTKDPEAEKLATIDLYLRDPSVRERSWRWRADHPAWRAEPNAGHRALVALERMGKLHTLVTQNVDGLHQKAGSSPELVIEMHGSMREVLCVSCGDRAPTHVALDRVRAGEADPACRSCGGILKTSTVFFGEGLDPRDVERAERAAVGSDVFLALGSSLQVYPVALLPRLAVDSGARLVVCNAEETPYDRQADAVIREPLGELLPALVGRL